MTQQNHNPMNPRLACGKTGRQITRSATPARFFSAVMLASASLLFAGAAYADQDIDERQDAAPDGRVEVANISGEIVVSGWDRNEIHITGTLGRGVERLDFIREGDLTIIEVIYPDHGNSHGSDLHIKLPRASSLEVMAVSAPIRVDGVEGRQRLNTVSGDVTTEAFASDVEAETVSGDLAVSGQDEATHTSLQTVSGSIEAIGISGELEASTVSGKIVASARMLSRARLNTTNGRITLEGGLASNGRYDLSTTNGRVEVMLDSDKDLDVDAQTFTGSIDNCFGVEATKSRYTSERTLRFQDGEANRTIRIRSMVGRIDICSENRS